VCVWQTPNALQDTKCITEKVEAAGVVVKGMFSCKSNDLSSKSKATGMIKVIA